MSNALRVLAYEQAEGARIDDQVAVMGFEVDDQSPEELALGLDALRGMDSVIDVIQLAAIGKKGRMASQVQLLARPEGLDAAIDACFAETTTWVCAGGSRRAPSFRVEPTVAGPQREVAVKVATRPGGARTAKAQIDHIGVGPGGQAGACGAGGRRKRWPCARARDGGDEREAELTGCSIASAGRGRGERRRRQHDPRGRGHDGSAARASMSTRSRPPCRPRRPPACGSMPGGGLEPDILDAGEFADPDYLNNPVDRCYFCKTNLYGAMAARTDGDLVSGTNLDDLGDYRPGLRPQRNGVRHPFVEAGMSKAAVPPWRAPWGSTISPSCRRRHACRAGSRPASR